MGICILGMGDCGSQSSPVVEKTTKTLNKILTNMVKSTSNSATIESISVQSATVQLGNIKASGNCKVNVGNITQNMTGSQNVKINLDLSSTSNLQTQVANALKGSVDNTTTQTQTVLSTASSSSSPHTNINDFIENLTQTNITDTTTQQLTSIIQSFQNATISGGSIECDGNSVMDSYNISQNMVVKQIVDLLTKELLKKSSANDFEADIDPTVRGGSNIKNDGLGGMITSIAKIFGGVVISYFIVWLTPILLIICCCCFLCLRKKSSSGSSKDSKLSAFGKHLKKMK